MILGVYICLQRAIPGVEPLNLEGQAVGAVQFHLDCLARETNLVPIRQLLCAEEREARDFLEEIGLDPDEVQIPHEEWFDAAEGRRTLQGLVAQLRQVPESLPNAEAVIRELEAMEQILAAAEAVAVRFHFALDLPL